MQYITHQKFLFVRDEFLLTLFYDLNLTQGFIFVKSLNW